MKHSLSYWEYKSWFHKIDFAIIGSGIAGLSTALELRNRFPKANIVLFEKGILPQGASTKNAGFACFGSISEILSDIETSSEAEVYALVEKRWKGLQKLRALLGDEAIAFRSYGGYEIFTKDQYPLYQKCFEHISTINELLHPIFHKNVFENCLERFAMQGIDKIISNPLEGQIDTGKMMNSLLHLAQQKGIKILNGITLSEYVDTGNSVQLKFENGWELYCDKLCITTNGFAKGLLKLHVKPARAQVLITSPIEDLQIKGTFHMDEGYYYFRNIDNRVLFGGGRNLDFKTEETSAFGLTETIQSRLEQLLRTTILPHQKFEVEHRWSGIMGIGTEKSPIVKRLSENVSCGVRLGGMGVAIGSLVGEELAQLHA